MPNRKKLAVIGCPVEHSLSPVMHNAAIKSLGLDLTYNAVRVEKNKLANFLKIAYGEYCGFNVTVPHKSAVIQLLDDITENASISNSVNTVLVDDKGKLHGDSTDGYGLEMALKESFNLDIKNKFFLFIGCGGAAQASSVHLLSQGAEGIFFVNRTLGKAEYFVNRLNARFSGKAFACSLNNTEEINNFFKKKPVIIQSTSLGLNRNDPCPLPDKFFKKELIYFDMIYNRNTPFSEKAKALNCRCADGSLMLLYQGARSFSIWTGCEAPVDIMKKALFTAMGKK